MVAKNTMIHFIFSPFHFKTFVFFFSFVLVLFTWLQKKWNVHQPQSLFKKKKPFGGSLSFSYCHGLLLVCFFLFSFSFLFSYLFYSHGCKT